MIETPTVAWCCDDGFLAPSLVSAHSVLKHRNGPTDVRFYLDKVTPHARAWAARLGEAFPEAQVTVDSIDLPEGQVGHYWTYATYGRLLLREKIGRRVLYLDGDTMTFADIGPLYRARLRGRPAAGVLDYPVERMQAHRRRGRDPLAREPWLPGKLMGLEHLLDLDSYINTGVLLLDYGNPAHDAIFDRLCDLEAALAFREDHKTPFVDQDWINHVLRGRIRLMAPEWNSGYGNHRSGKTPMPLWRRWAHRPAREAPKILHYWGREKPWMPEARPVNAAAAALIARYREDMAEAVACIGSDLGEALKRPPAVKVNDAS